MLNSFSWLSRWGVESRDDLRSWPWISVWLLMCTQRGQKMEIALRSEARVRALHQSSASHWWSGGIVNFPSHFSGLRIKEGKLFCNLADVFSPSPPPQLGWKCKGCRWEQARRETPGSAASFKSGNLQRLSRLLGHKLFFGWSNFRDFPKGVNKPFWGELHPPA